MYQIAREQLGALLRRIGEDRTLLLPVRKGGKTNFALWEEGAEVDLAAAKTVKSPKDAFFPQCQTLYTCRREDGKLALSRQEPETEPFVVLGIRPCDVRALTVLDNVFLSPPVDTFYAARRANGTTVSLACGRPSPSCFCGSFGVDCAEPEGDVAAWLTEKTLYWLPRTEKGRELTALVSPLLEACGPEEAEQEKAHIRALYGRLPLKDLSLEGWGADAARSRFDAPQWEKLYRGCLACGTCTFVCPTCQCYDICDYDTGSGVQRFRCWDSCMYSDFTMMAHGNNRTSQLQRFRQRFLHKLAYYPANYGGMFSCVGCGRCVDSCPSHLNIVKVMASFGKGET